jgi:lysyl-tRNA synthetase class 2
VRTHRLDEFRKEFGERLPEEEKKFLEEEVAVTGRVNTIRGYGKLIFIDIVGDDAKVQILCSKANWQGEQDFDVSMHAIKRGDIVGVTGKPGRSKTGELSVEVAKTELLSYCYY